MKKNIKVVDKNSVKINGTTFTNSELSEILSTMNECNSCVVSRGESSRSYVNFSLLLDRTGWFSPDNMNNYGSIRNGDFCLRRKEAEDLFNFLTNYFQEF